MRAAQYLRMSTDAQPTSIDAQAAAISAYAEARGIEVVHTYLDAGRSGLSLRGRPELQRLLADAQRPHCPFDLILVYDVSRWGRFQEVDEAAKLEQICREAGAPVIYCAEQFEGAGPMVTALMKTVRRVMAAEYSRDLSEKVGAARRRLAGQGYWTGGQAPFGYRRWVVDANGEERLLKPGQHKGVGGHTVLRLGPADEVRTVRRLFRLYVEHRRNRAEVARILNTEAAPGPGGRAWTQTSVARVLERPTYTGVIADGRLRGMLGGGRQLRTSGPWAVAPDAVEPIISQSLFRRAQTLQTARRDLRRTWTEEQLIDGLAALHNRCGKLSAATIDADPALPSHSVYVQRFTTLGNAYILAGLPATAPSKARAAMEAMRRRRSELSGELALLLHARGREVDICRGAVILDGWLRLRFCPANPFTRPTRGMSWEVKPLVGPYRYLIGVRLAAVEGDVIDYALLDHHPSRAHFRIGPKSARWRDSARADSMDGLADLLEQRL